MTQLLGRMTRHWSCATSSVDRSSNWSGWALNSPLNIHLEISYVFQSTRCARIEFLLSFDLQDSNDAGKRVRLTIFCEFKRSLRKVKSMVVFEVPTVICWKLVISTKLCSLLSRSFVKKLRSYASVVVLSVSSRVTWSGFVIFHLYDDITKYQIRLKSMWGMRLTSSATEGVYCSNIVSSCESRLLCFNFSFFDSHFPFS
jgi:hypothetical protein